MKAEFDSLKNTFQAEINRYKNSLDNKIDGAIAGYLAGVNVPKWSSWGWEYRDLYDDTLTRWVDNTEDQMHPNLTWIHIAYMFVPGLHAWTTMGLRMWYEFKLIHAGAGANVFNWKWNESRAKWIIDNSVRENLIVTSAQNSYAGGSKQTFYNSEYYAINHPTANRPNYTTSGQMVYHANNTPDQWYSTISCKYGDNPDITTVAEANAFAGTWARATSWGDNGMSNSPRSKVSSYQSQTIKTKWLFLNNSDDLLCATNDNVLHFWWGDEYTNNTEFNILSGNQTYYKCTVAKTDTTPPTLEYEGLTTVGSCVEFNKSHVRKLVYYTYVNPTHQTTDNCRKWVCRAPASYVERMFSWTESNGLNVDSYFDMEHIILGVIDKGITQVQFQANTVNIDAIDIYLNDKNNSKTLIKHVDCPSDKSYTIKVDVDEGLLVMQPSFSNSEDNVSLTLMNPMQLKE